MLAVDEIEVLKQPPITAIMPQMGGISSGLNRFVEKAVFSVSEISEPNTNLRIAPPANPKANVKIGVIHRTIIAATMALNQP